MIEHCISAFSERQQEKSFRIYVTDTLSYIAKNTAKQVKEGVYVGKRWIDIIEPKKEDDRSGDEVAMEIIEKLGLRVE